MKLGAAAAAAVTTTTTSSSAAAAAAAAGGRSAVAAPSPSSRLGVPSGRACSVTRNGNGSSGAAASSRYYNKNNKNNHYEEEEYIRDKYRKRKPLHLFLRRNRNPLVAAVALVATGLALGRLVGSRIVRRRRQQLQQAFALRNLKSKPTRHLERLFEEHRGADDADGGGGGTAGDARSEILRTWLERVDADVVQNVAGGTRWIRPYLLPSLEGDDDAPQPKRINHRDDAKTFLKVKRARTNTRMKWEDEYEALLEKGNGQLDGPVVDYTDPDKYEYPDVPSADAAVPPPASEYPPLKPLKQLMEDWNQDEDYFGTIREGLHHFDYNDPRQMEMAKKYRDAELPYKLVNVPELIEANKKWTDEYVSRHFQNGMTSAQEWLGHGDMPPARGLAQESPNNYFAFFSPNRWDLNTMGLPPVRHSDWSFEKWSQHARYADAVRLQPDRPHFYWQSGIDADERHKDKSQWTFISRDLPSFSSPMSNDVVFNVEEQKGIQCRFGERGVVAATHYDSGMNHVGMITGAKRYILSPPRECSKLGIFTSRKSSIYRHSLLNFAHILLLDDDNKDSTAAASMSDEERGWLQRAGTAQSIETVLKAGEILYIPSHWFHYIISVQKSAQCNVRSGVHIEGHPVFGNKKTVEECRDF